MFYIVFKSTKKIVHISATRCPIEMGLRSKGRIFNRQVIYIEKSKLNIADMWLISLDRVTLAQNIFVCQLVHNLYDWRLLNYLPAFLKAVKTEARIAKGLCSILFLNTTHFIIFWHYVQHGFWFFKIHHLLNMNKTLKLKFKQACS